MKSLKHIFAVLSCTLAFAAPSQAIPLTLENTSSSQLIANASNNALTLNFNFNSLLAANNANSGDITSAMLTILFSDPNRDNERYKVSVALGSQTVSPNGNNNVNNGNGNVTTETITFTLPALNDLKADGIVSALISAIEGEFFFNSASLAIQVKPSTAAPGSVPEPATLALLGMGLLGAASFRRRR